MIKAISYPLSAIRVHLASTSQPSYHPSHIHECGCSEAGVNPARPRHCNGRITSLTTPLGNREGE